MLQKAKLALRISTDVYDSEILDLIEAGANDLRHAGPVFDFTPVLSTTSGEVEDYTVLDPLARQAIITYVRAHFGSPSDYDKLAASYDSQKGQLRESFAYGMEVLH